MTPALLLRHLAVPIAWAALSAALSFASATGLAPGLQPIVHWLWACLPWIVLMRVAALYLFDVHLRTSRNIELPALVPSLVIALAYGAIGFAVFRVQHPTFSVLPLLATSAITSVVLGFALQPVLANLFAGVAVSLDQPFRLNDHVRIGATEGRVTAINWHSTHLRTSENDEVIIANAKLTEQPIVNLYYPNPMHLTRVRVGTDLDRPPYRVRQVLVDCAANIPGLLDKPSPDAALVEFAPDCAVYELRCWVEDAAESGGVANELRTRIWDAFHRQQFRLTFPGSILRDTTPATLRVGAQLFATSGPLRGHTLSLTGTTTIGRTEGCAIHLTAHEASGEHARLERDGAGWCLIDLNSKYGTTVNGAAITRHLLADLDRITIADSTFVFEAGDGR